MALSTLLKRIEKKIWKKGPNECWPWLGYINEDGEARIWVDDELGSIPVPKAWYMVRGETIPEGKEAMSCPILKDCANPDHHSLASREEVADRILWRKGLVRRPSRSQRQKLSDEQVKQIFLSTERTSVLAAHYQVTEGQISNIRAGRVRQSVTDPLRQMRDQSTTEVRNGEQGSGQGSGSGHSLIGA